MFLSEDLPMPSRVRIALNGAVRISTDALTTINGKPVNSCLYLSSKTVCDLTFDGGTTLEIESALTLPDLEVSELQAIVDFHDVATSAGTKAGLIRAIERELEVDP